MPGRAVNVNRACLIALLLGAAVPASGQSRRPIDTANSRVIVRVYKSGLFSPFAHNHEIEARIAEGEVDLGNPPSVTLSFQSARLRVLDPEASSRTRAEIQRTMLGPEVLDVARFPEIRFASQHVNEAGPDRWRVEGELTLHGMTKPVAFVVTEAAGVYRGAVLLRQTDFGIRPVRLAGGTIKVKDQVHIEFEIRIANPPAAAGVGNFH